MFVRIHLRLSSGLQNHMHTRVQPSLSPQTQRRKRKRRRRSGVEEGGGEGERRKKNDNKSKARFLDQMADVAFLLGIYRILPATSSQNLSSV